MLPAFESVFLKKLSYDWRVNKASDYRIIVQATVEKNVIRKYWDKQNGFLMYQVSWNLTLGIENQRTDWNSTI